MITCASIAGYVCKRPGSVILRGCGALTLRMKFRFKKRPEPQRDGNAPGELMLCLTSAMGMAFTFCCIHMKRLSGPIRVLTLLAAGATDMFVVKIAP